MALFIRQDETRTKFQEKIAAELREKAQKQAEHERLDGVDDSAYIKGTKKTTSLAWVWLAIFAAIIILIIYLVVKSLS